ncbi:MAG TPA: hypothetical protein VGL61_34815 [Kofleriaceae bacterium]
MWLALFAVVLAACEQPRAPSPPVDRAEVETGSLVRSDARIALDVLIPVDGDLPQAVDRGRATAAAEGLHVVDPLPAVAREPVVTVGLASIDDQRWRSELGDDGHGYVSTALSDEELDSVQQAIGVVRIVARGPTTRAWELIRAAMRTASDLAASQHGWIYQENRARLFDVSSFAALILEPGHRDVRTILRAMEVVSTHGKPSHVRSIGLGDLGVPELYVPDVPEDLIDVAANAVYATAQQLVVHGGVTRRGVIEVDAASLPASWGKPRGTGKITWRARWMHDPLKPTLVEIELTNPDLAAALRAF